jgi:hypothetical protein
MNKKLFVGAAALTTVAAAGYVYYKWVRTGDLTRLLDELSHDEVMERVEETPVVEDTSHG